MIHFRGNPILARNVTGIALAADIPLSFWGGLDPETGMIIDQRHPLAGHNCVGQVLVIPAGRGSCSGSGTILEAIQNQTAPAAILISRIDPIISLGCILGDELYKSHPALLIIAEHDRLFIKNGDMVTITKSGWVSVNRDRLNVTGPPGTASFSADPC